MQTFACICREYGIFSAYESKRLQVTNATNMPYFRRLSGMCYFLYMCVYADSKIAKKSKIAAHPTKTSLATALQGNPWILPYFWRLSAMCYLLYMCVCTDYKNKRLVQSKSKPAAHPPQTTLAGACPDKRRTKNGALQGQKKGKRSTGKAQAKKKKKSPQTKL